MMLSTSHLGSPSVISGDGWGKFSPCCSVSLYGVRSDAWKTLWIFHLSSSVILYATGDIMAATLKGPYHLGDSFGVK